ncbi:MAG: squalene/phytoene synthase family protein [Pseudomonadota bacterium]
MNALRKRHPLLAMALPAAKQAANELSPGMEHGNEHTDFAALMHTARLSGGAYLQTRLAALWPQASKQDLALAEGLGVALWLAEMLLFLREDAGRQRILLPQDLMQKNMVEAAQLIEGKHDFALRRLSEQLAQKIMKILQGSARLGLSAPLHLRYRLRWTMLYAGFILHTMQHDPQAPFIHPTPSIKDRLLMLKNTLFIASTSAQQGGSCGSGGCAS